MVYWRWNEQPDALRAALERHDALMRRAVEANAGQVLKTVGDAFCAAFATADAGLSGTIEAQRAIEAERGPGMQATCASGPVRLDRFEEVLMASTMSLTQVKARLSEVVRAARQGGEETIITVDGEPAARLVPVASSPRDLTDAEVAAVRVLLDAIARLDHLPGSFDAVELLAEGRR